MLWPLIHVTYKQLFAIDASLRILTLLVIMIGTRRNNLPGNVFFSYDTSTCCDKNNHISYQKKTSESQTSQKES